MPDSEWLTYKQLAERLGMGIDSARIKAKRRKWPIEPGNHPYAPSRVLVPSAFLNLERTPERTPAALIPSAPLSPHEITSERSPSAPLREELERQARLYREELAGRDRLHRESNADRDRLHRESMAMMIERVDAAEIRAERVEQRLDQILDQLLEQRRPWWARLLELWRRR